MKIHYATSDFKYLKPLPACFLLMLFLSISSYAQVSGIVFNDFNANGTKENTATYNEVDMAGVVVNATNPAGAALTVAYTGGGTSTNTTGNYTVTGGTAGQIRLEFVMPDSYTFASSGASGGTTVMFPSGIAQNLAVNYPQDYSQASPNLILPCYVGGALTGPNKTYPAIVKFGYFGSSGTISGDANGIPTPYSGPPTAITDHQHVGAVYGVAYERSSKKAYVGAVLRRHVVFGPQGPGGIYEIDPVTNTATNWLDLGSIAGTTTRDNTKANAIPTTNDADRSYDLAAFPLIGKSSLGDVDISDDGKTLFVVNLFEQSLVVIDIASKAFVSYPITASAVTPAINCPQSDFRPWGLKYYKGKVYVGVVCTTETSQNLADLKGYVLQFDPSTHGFSNFFSFPFNYARDDNKSLWGPWNLLGWDLAKKSELSRHPMPILSDIEFDVDGSMILGIMDRHTMMFSSANFGPDVNLNQSSGVTVFSNGDILRVCNTGSGLVMEGGAGCGFNAFIYKGATTAATEFYDDHRFPQEGTIFEDGAGALALLAGSGQVVSTTIDALETNENSVGWWNNTDGNRNRAYELTQGTNSSRDQGKAAGLGDIELLSDAAPIEIGNRVWEDKDADGVQDAGEPALGGVTVTLCDAAGTPIPGATATTDPNGNYYFSTATGASTPSAIYGLNLSFDTTYILKFPTTNGTKSLSPKDLGENDLVDSDAGKDGKISFTTGYAGQNNHSFDVGYSVSTCTKPTVGTAVATQATCTGSTANSDAKIDVTGIAGGNKYSYGTDSTTFTYASATAFTGAAINITALANPAAATTYYVRVHNATDDCFKTVSVVLNPKSCTVVCTKPTVGTAVATQQATCTGSTANSDAKIDVTGISGGDKYSYGTDSTAFTYASATAFTSATVNITGLANPAATATYYIRIYNAAEDCFKTVSAVLNPMSCTVTCTKPSAGTDQSPVCSGNTAITTATLAATAVTGGAWTLVGTNPAGATITDPNSATSGVTALTPGIYKFIWATSVTCSDTVKIVIPNCQTSPPCTPDIFAYWNFEDCSPGSNTPNDGMTAAITNLSGCSALTVSKLTRAASGNSCQTRSNGTTAVCMGSATNLTFEDNSDKAIMFSLTYPAGSTGKLSSISFETMTPKFVDFNNSGDTTNINNHPTLWGIRILKNGVEIFKLIDQPLSLNNFTINNLDWSTNPDFDINGATVFKFEILGYLPANVACGYPGNLGFG